MVPAEADLSDIVKYGLRRRARLRAAAAELTVYSLAPQVYRVPFSLTAAALAEDVTQTCLIPLMICLGVFRCRAVPSPN